MEITEKDFEATIESALLAGGPGNPVEDPRLLRDRFSFPGEFTPGGYRRRMPGDYDPGLCLIPHDVVAFIQATQPKQWLKLKKQHGEGTRKRLLRLLAREIDRRGTIHVLRNGVKDVGARLQMAYFRPHSGLNPELQEKYRANLFSVVRQLAYSQTTGHTLDLAIFLNGMPIFTAELKNPLTGQTWKHAVVQYKRDRDPKESLFQFGRCLAHFAVDPHEVHFCTHLQGQETVFFPFNLGYAGGAGNPPSIKGFDTAYLWEQTWARDSVLDLLQNFVHLIEVRDDMGKKTGQRRLIFPRHHQLEAVRGLVEDARVKGPGQRYLVQHSAGSGKTFSISWLAHQLSVLHDEHDRAIFDSIIVVTDRRVLDQQLQDHVTQFEQVSGVVEPITGTSQQLKDALQAGKKIIVSTLQKFPVIEDEMETLAGNRFAVVIDEAHSSQTGESARSVRAVLATSDLDEAEKLDAEGQEELEDRILREVEKRGRRRNVSHFAFTATPKPKTLELFGTQNARGAFEPFSLYSMRQAIEEGFILDVLDNYTTYRAYWNLLKKVQDDPRYDTRKAKYLLKRFVDLHEHTIDQKLEIIVEHFRQHVMHKIRGKAKAMIVTRSRAHAVRYKQAIDRYLKAHDYESRALVAFSGTVKDRGDSFTETGMNGFPESQTVEKFKRDEFRFMIVAEKFQTGFDQPLLYAMYVDKTLRGLHAVQTLSRLNRTYEYKDGTMVLDFANEAQEIQLAFEPYYEKTILSEGTDPHLLYDLENKIADFHLFTNEDLERFAEAYFNPKANQALLLSILRPVVDRAKQSDDERVEDFRSALGEYKRLYSFLSQIVSFADARLEQLYHFARYLVKVLPSREVDMPLDVLDAVDLGSLRIQETFGGDISIKRGTGELKPRVATGDGREMPEEIEPLSAIITELNEKFGADLKEEDKITIEQLVKQMSEDIAVKSSLEVNTKENARLTFNNVAEERVQELIESNFRLYKLIVDDKAFQEHLFRWMFERLLEGQNAGG